MTTADAHRELAKWPRVTTQTGMAWQQVGENLVRHPAGTIYLRAKVAGKIVRRSLKTSDLRIAKLKRDDLLDRLRKAATRATTGGVPRTVGDALTVAGDRLKQPHLKARTLEYYDEILQALRKALPTDRLCREWTREDALAWWRVASKAMAPQQANNALLVVRVMVAVMTEHGMQVADPLEGIKRLRIPKRKLVVPSRPEMEEIIASIKSQGKRASAEASRLVAFLAYSGCRIGEARGLCWEDVGKEWLTVTGGEAGTKNNEIRRVPISAPLRQVLDDLRYEGAEGPVFSLRSPRGALTAACTRLGVPHLRVHDLRHFFATWSIESGVDIPTVAKWLGHKDGGALAMRTYGHLRDAHSLASAKKLR